MQMSLNFYNFCLVTMTCGPDNSASISEEGLSSIKRWAWRYPSPDLAFIPKDKESNCFWIHYLSKLEGEDQAR